jgi:hypothetical protein
MADDEREEHQRQETLKLYFDYFKHMTTIGAAATVVLLAVYREGVGERLWVTGTLVLFGTAVVAALFGMFMTLTLFREGMGLDLWIRAWAILSSAALVGGIVTFMRRTLGLPRWTTTALVLLLVLLYYASYHRPQRERDSDR